MTFGSLFAGIGGFDLGLERAGMECKWQVEIEPYAARVLQKQWPHVTRHDDIKTFPPSDGDWSVDLICGGFPCQDISFAGKGAGIHGERSGLFFEVVRVARLLRPQWLLLENVSALLVRGLDVVLGELAAIRYDCEWHWIPAAYVGAPHIRDRIWIVGTLSLDSDTNSKSGMGNKPSQTTARAGIPANANGTRLEKRPLLGINAREELAAAFRSNRGAGGCWEDDAGIRRVAHGVPHRMVRFKCLGNAVVPQVAEFIGKKIMESEGK